MSKAKEVSTPLAGYFNLNTEKWPSSEKEKAKMKSVPFASVVCSLMHAMVCTRPDTTHAVGVVSMVLELRKL